MNRNIAIYAIDNQFFATIFLLNHKLIVLSVTKMKTSESEEERDIENIINTQKIPIDVIR